jgi:YVTN family beta-propeller protein
MAAAHRSSNRAKAKANRMKARHRAAQHRRSQASTWLGAGALTLGVGAALASGSGTAYADSPPHGGSSLSSHPSSPASSASSTGSSSSSKTSGKTPPGKTHLSSSGATASGGPRVASTPSAAATASTATTPSAGSTADTSSTSSTGAGTTASLRRSARSTDSADSSPAGTLSTGTPASTAPTGRQVEVHAALTRTPLSVDPTSVSATGPSGVVAPAVPVTAAPAGSVAPTGSGSGLSEALSGVLGLLGADPLPNPGPVAPPVSPAGWTLLAFARRELGAQNTLGAQSATAPVTTTSTAAPLKVTTTPTATTAAAPAALVRAAVTTPAVTRAAVTAAPLAAPAAAPTINGVPVVVVVGALAVVAVALVAAPAIALLALDVAVDLTAVGVGVALEEGVAAVGFNAVISFAPPVISDVLGLASIAATGTAGEFLGVVTSGIGAIQTILNSITGGAGSTGTTGTTGTGTGTGTTGTGTPGGNLGTGCTNATCTVMTNGQVMGTVSFANGTNTFSVTSGPSQGTVVVNSATGAFTYIPTEAAQLTATGLSTDMFTETATKGALTSQDQITVPISGATLAVTNTINVGGAVPEGVAVSPDGTAVYVADTDTSTGTGQVSVINTKTGAVTTVPVGSQPFGVAVSNTGADVYVTNELDGTVSVIDTATNLVNTFPVGNGNSESSANTPDSPAGVATSSAGAAFVANEGAGSVTVITNNGPANLTTFSGLPSQAGPAGVAVSPNGQQLYVTISNGDLTGKQGDLEVVNTSTGAISGPVGVGFNPVSVAVSPTGSLVYVANEFATDTATTGGENNGTVSVINTANNEVTDTIPLAGSPSSANAVAFSPDGSLAYVTDTTVSGGQAGTTVQVINTATNKVIDTVTVGNGPASVAVAPNGTAYVTNAFGSGNFAQGTVSVISLVQNG